MALAYALPHPLHLYWLKHESAIVGQVKEIRTMKEQLTAVFQEVPEGYIGFVEELPGANTQGATPRRSPIQSARSREARPGSQSVLDW